MQCCLCLALFVHLINNNDNSTCFCRALSRATYCTMISHPHQCQGLEELGMLAEVGVIPKVRSESYPQFHSESLRKGQFSNYNL